MTTTKHRVLGGVCSFLFFALTMVCAGAKEIFEAEVPNDDRPSRLYVALTVCQIASVTLGVASFWAVRGEAEDERGQTKITTGPPHNP